MFGSPKKRVKPMIYTCVDDHENTHAGSILNQAKRLLMPMQHCYKLSHRNDKMECCWYRWYKMRFYEDGLSAYFDAHKCDETPKCPIS